MSDKRIHDLMERARRGEDITGEPGVGEPILTTEPIEVTDDVMVGKSVRVPKSMISRIEAVAESRGSDWSNTIRRWIEEGLARDEATEVHDPRTIAALDALDTVRRLVVEGGRDRDQAA